MSTLFFRNRQLLALTILVITVGGLSAIFSLSRLEDPRLNNRTAVIVTRLPGASAGRVESQVTEKIEDELREVAEIKDLDSTSRAGVSMITVELDGRIVDSERVWSELRDKVADARSELPPDALEPEFDDTRGPVAFGVILGLKWTGAGTPPRGVLKRLAEELGDRLRNLRGTEIVRIYGEADEEITVALDPDALADLNLRVEDVARAIDSADAKVPAGVIRGSGSDMQIEVEGELDSLDRIGGVPLVEGALGQIVRLSDVSEIRRAQLDPPREMALVDGRPAILVAARVTDDRRLDHWTADALAVAEQFDNELSSNTELKRVFVQNEYTSRRLQGLTMNLLAGAAIVMAVIAVMMGWRSALLVGVALPLTVAAVLTGLSVLGIPLHQMSITGLIIALGLLIDNAIVVVDEVRTRLAKRIPPADAIASAVGHLFIPLLGSTLTTVLAFMPILLLSGSVGEFVRTMATTVILALVASLAIALSIVATLTGLFGRSGDARTSRTWWRDGISIDWLSAATERFFEAALRRPALSMLLAAAVPLAGFAFAPQLRNQFFPPADREQFYLQMWLPSDSAIAGSTETAKAIDAVLRQDPSIVDADWVIGRSAPTVYYNMLMNRDDSSAYAQAILRTGADDDVPETINRLQQTLDLQFPEARIVLRRLGQGPPIDAPVEIRVYGSSIPRLRELGDEIRGHLYALPDVLHTQASLDGGEPKLWVRADENETNLAGLTLGEVARQLEGSLEGYLGGSIIEQNEELPVRLRFDNSRRSDPRNLASINLRTAASNDWVPTSTLGEIELRPAQRSITHRNSERVNVIQAHIAAEALPPEVTAAMMDRLQSSGFELPAGYRIELGGDVEEQRDAIANLLNYVPLLAVLMLATLVLSFRSFAMAGLIGVVAALSVGLGLIAVWISGYPYGFMAIIGTAGLIGVAINDSIVVLASIRANARAAAGDPSAVAEEVMHNTRHVLSTTLTTSGGFLPLLLSGGGFWPPLAVVIAGGVTGATMIALVFVPAAYVAVARLQTQNAVEGAEASRAARHSPAAYVARQHGRDRAPDPVVVT